MLSKLKLFILTYSSPRQTLAGPDLAKLRLAVMLSFFISGSWAHADRYSQSNTTSTQQQGSSQPTMADSAKQANAANTLAQGINAAMGALQMDMAMKSLEQAKQTRASCATPSCPAADQQEMMGQMLMMQGMQSLAQMAANAQGAGQASSIGNSLSWGTPSMGEGGANGWDSVADTLKKLEAKGIKVDKKTGNLKLPNGKILKPESASSKQAALAAGISGKAYDRANAISKKIQEKVNAKMGANNLEALALGAGGGASYVFSPSSSSSSDPFGEEPEELPLAKGPTDRAPADISGMNKSYNGEPIGVAVDNIFDMIKRRYSLKEKQDFFIPYNDNEQVAGGASAPNN